MDNRLKTKQKTNYTFIVEVQNPVTDNDGNITFEAFDLTGYTVALGVKERKDSKNYKIYKAGAVDADPTTGLVTFELTYTDTDVQPKVYTYGVLIENDGTQDRRELEIENPFFEIEPSIVYEPEPSS